jgi:hypothetical protein
VICWSAVRRFDGDALPSLHASVYSRGALGLRFVSWVTLDKATGRYAPTIDAPAFAMAWVPAEMIADETSSATEIDAALAQVDQIPLILVAPSERPVAYISDSGSSFPVVGIKGSAMVLAVRVEQIARGTHGQLTFGWEGDRC